MSLSEQVARYYADRTPVYDMTAGHLDAEAEALRAPIKQRYHKLFAGRAVLEVACGTGYWTAVVAETARSIMATDIHAELLRLAAQRCQRQPHVTFRAADAFTLEGVPGDFDAGMAILWWSHTPRERVREWLTALHSRLRSGALVMFVDQSCYDTHRRRTDDSGNTIETRWLPNGRCYEIVKNFPTEQQLRTTLDEFGTDIRYTERPTERSWEVIYSAR